MVIGFTNLPALIQRVSVKTWISSSFATVLRLVMPLGLLARSVKVGSGSPAPFSAGVVSTVSGALVLSAIALTP